MSTRTSWSSFRARPQAEPSLAPIRRHLQAGGGARRASGDGDGDVGGGGPCCSRPHAARADGAFPNGQSILVPADRPDEIVLGHQLRAGHLRGRGRNVDLVVRAGGHQLRSSLPDGAGPGAPAATPSPRGKLVYSDDGACGWQAAAGTLGDDLCEDAFVDPTDGTRVLAAGLAGGRRRRLCGLRVDRRRRDVRWHTLHGRARRSRHRHRDRAVRSDDDRPRARRTARPRRRRWRVPPTAARPGR